MHKKPHSPYCIQTAVEPDSWITVDCDNARPASIIAVGQSEDTADHRPITERERREIIYDTLAYGRTPLLYRLFRLWMLSMAKGAKSGKDEANKAGNADKPSCILTSVEPDEWITIDSDNARPVSITVMGQSEHIPVHRTITKRERREIALHTLAYGRTPLLYRLFRLWILSMTKRMYPRQGAPNIKNKSI